ncbi:hypothetical protein EDD37DRAFT_117274 [Exophiala viscosa]|uniref:uncharacterized protein n=1 Tax=Exophiala viscosa TaxID=2486360 RepID=UPI002198D32A|nr:hypothetical protein EDD37DRAFT_117274 [Exophiala viscosa]
MAAQYVPVFSHDEHHQAAGINEVEIQRKNQRLSGTQLSSLHIDDDERNLTSSQTVDGTSTPPKESLASILHDHWLWELASLFLSTAALAAVVVLLIYWGGKPLFQWSSSISLNTFVSTLGTAHKSGLALFIGACLGQQKWNWFHQHTDRLEVLETFAEASRGPWGSTKLIYQLLPRWNLSHLACLVLLISLTFDAFLQATISLHGSMDRSTDIYSIPMIGRSTNAAVGSLLIIPGSPEAVYPEGNSSGPDYDGFTTYPSLGLVSAIFNGLDDSSAAQQDRVGSS